MFSDLFKPATFPEKFPGSFKSRNFLLRQMLGFYLNLTSVKFDPDMRNEFQVSN